MHMKRRRMFIFKSCLRAQNALFMMWREGFVKDDRSSATESSGPHFPEFMEPELFGTEAQSHVFLEFSSVRVITYKVSPLLWPSFQWKMYSAVCMFMYSSWWALDAKRILFLSPLHHLASVILIFFYFFFSEFLDSILVASAVQSTALCFWMVRVNEDRINLSLSGS